MAQIVRRVTSEMFSQFTSNLNTLLCCDDPEVVHQARVGWRRFTSAIRLFRPLLAPGVMPSWQPLQTLLVCLGRLRDLDVARTETLPPLADAYVAADARRAELWGKMTLALLDASMLQRKAVRYGLADPGVGACLLATTQWLEGNMLAVAIENAKPEPGSSPRQWTRRRILRLHERLKMARKQADSPERKHRVRILAKRMRYNLEALQSLLPRKRTQRWRAQASHLQTHFGATRDAMQAATLVADLELDRGLAEFLRGLALGRN
jgi:CHAD domain-containing protein